MIDIETLKEYIKVLEDSSLQTLEISDGEDSLYLEKPSAPAAAPAVEMYERDPGGNRRRDHRGARVRRRIG